MTRVSIALLGCVLVIAGCSSKSEQAPAESSPATPAAHGSLAECLHSHGVPASAGPAVALGRPDGVDQATWDKAMEECSKLGPGPAGS